MARKRKSTKRDTTAIASNKLLSSTITTMLSELEDRRSFHPLGDYRPARGFSKSASLIGIQPVGDRKVERRSKSRGDVFQFAVPNKVAICVRRKERREALFALRRTGKGARSRKRRNYYSDVSCR